MDATIETKPRTISVEDAVRELGIGRQLGYQLARTGELPGVMRLGHRFVVSRERFDAALRGEADEHRAG
jgi:predicted DNA-binding transcriptional regulator AlpA